MRSSFVDAYKSVCLWKCQWVHSEKCAFIRAMHAQKSPCRFPHICLSCISVWLIEPQLVLWFLYKTAFCSQLSVHLYVCVSWVECEQTWQLVASFYYNHWWKQRAPGCTLGTVHLQEGGLPADYLCLNRPSLNYCHPPGCIYFPFRLFSIRKDRTLAWISVRDTLHPPDSH